LILAICIIVTDITSIWTGVVAVGSAIIHAWRIRLWHVNKVWNDPMLWSLHTGYIWLVIGLSMLGLSGFGITVPSTAIHTLTTGAIGSMTIAMMCRVALGHTGRALKSDNAIATLLILMQVAAIVRITAFFLDDYYQYGVLISGALWSFAFGIYLLRFTPVLFTHRPDGKPA
jgi:uncharacterized protein involved in response to NO